ncbi:MAG: hypothetical protein QOG83_2705 [Alphaproteobacteria bacterium]|nr:hypothetical protein [Alphaproteobacteria bacterium]
MFTSPLNARGRIYSVPRFIIDPEVLAVVALLSTALVIGLATAGDYGMTVDEFNTDDYGPKALAWYTSGFTDRSHFETVEQYLWYYGPWFHMLTAFAQSFNLANPVTVRHAMTFSVGLMGLAALLPMARLTVGRWAGLAAISLCLMTGYLYGSLFFTPIDVPFLAAMTWATLAVILMAQRVVPSWPATICAGLLTGLAIATRTGGIITHAYLLGAMVLGAIAAVVHHGYSAKLDLLRISARTLCVMAIAWTTAIALWPWLQIGNPFWQFKIALVHFTTIPMSFQFPHWGEFVWTNAPPATYIPAQLLARLPEAFILCLLAGLAFGLATTIGFSRACLQGARLRGTAGLRAPALFLARSRGILVLWAAAIFPIAFLIVQRSTLYDGVRHVLFIIPILAVVAGAGFARLLPTLATWRRVPALASAAGGAYVGMMIWTLVSLHPLEYVATNLFAGGLKGAYGRFEHDYWSVAATVALRRLEQRLDYESAHRGAERTPTILMCIGARETMVGPIFGRPWIIEVDPLKADFIIETERWRCAGGSSAVLIDEVRRFDRAFAWTYARQPAAINQVNLSSRPAQ